MSIMANWDKEVCEKLGPVVFKLIRDYVTNHVTNIDVMNDIAQILSDGAGGANQRRRGGFDERAMRDILSDWYNEEMHKMTREAAVKRLIAVFKDNSVNLKPLAHDLEQKLTDSSVQHTDRTEDSQISNQGVNRSPSTSNLENLGRSDDKESMDTDEEQDTPKPLPDLTKKEKQGSKRRDFSKGLDLSKSKDIPHRESFLKAKANNVVKAAKATKTRAENLLWRGRFMSERQKREQSEKDNKELSEKLRRSERAQAELSEQFQRSISLQSTSKVKVGHFHTLG